MGIHHQKDQSPWDAICARCARCCYEKIDYQGVIYYTELSCEHLDTESRLCRVYNDRAEVRKGCVQLTPERVKAGFLPVDCPYVEGLEDYRAPVMPDDEDPP